MTLLPSLYIAHGGGPLPVLGDQNHSKLTKHLTSLPDAINVKSPSAVLVISAHWEAPVPTITSSPSPPLIYDYYGFPPQSYSLKYNPPGSPQLAENIASLLHSAGFSDCTLDSTRGLDHGAFIPLMLNYPAAKIPVLQLSLLSSLDPETHIRMGEALAPLRSQGVLIYGSGMSFHNMQVFMSSMGNISSSTADKKSVEFDQYLKQSIIGGGVTYGEGRKMLVHWKDAPNARYAHPREEHLLPLMVAYGASKKLENSGDGDNEKVDGEVLFSEPLLGAHVSSFGFR